MLAFISSPVSFSFAAGAWTTVNILNDLNGSRLAVERLFSKACINDCAGHLLVDPYWLVGMNENVMHTQRVARFRKSKRHNPCYAFYPLARNSGRGVGLKRPLDHATHASAPFGSNQNEVAAHKFGHLFNQLRLQIRGHNPEQGQPYHDPQKRLDQRY